MSKTSRKQRAKASAKERRCNEYRLNKTQALLRDKIRKWDDPILAQVCVPVEKTDSLDFVQELKDVLKATKDGLGLSAPQIGVKKNAFVYYDHKTGSIEVVINPLIIKTSPTTLMSHEGCLSYPNFFIDTERFSDIQVAYKNERWEDYTKWLGGRNSVVYQHEFDHCAGICRVGDEWRKAMGIVKEAEQKVKETEQPTSI